MTFDTSILNIVYFWLNRLNIEESHQSRKADTSGTAKEMVKYFNGLTTSEFQVQDIVKHREIEKQKEFGVPKNHLGGHAFHTYSLKSTEGDVSVSVLKKF